MVLAVCAAMADQSGHPSRASPSKTAPYLTEIQLRNQLRQLVSPGGPSHGTAADLLTAASGSGELLHNLLLESLLDTSGRKDMLTEMEALIAIVHLLAVGTGDPNGDTVTPDALNPGAGELERAQLENPIRVAYSLRSPAMVSALIDVLDRHGAEFERGDSTYLQWQVLKALRLVITPEGLLHVGAAQVEATTWFTNQDLGCPRDGEMWRRLVQVLLHQLQSVGDTMSQKPKIIVLGCLWSLAQASSFLRTRILQSGGQALVASLLRAQVQQRPQLPSALVVECGVLVALAAGPRAHQRHMAKLQVDQDVLEMLRRFKVHREVVFAGLVLLTYLASDETVTARLAASAEALAAIAEARAQWPKEAGRAITSCTHYLSSTAAALLKGTPSATLLKGNAPAALSRPRTETPRGCATRSRPVRAAAVCVVGGAER